MQLFDYYYDLTYYATITTYWEYWYPSFGICMQYTNKFRNIANDNIRTSGSTQLWIPTSIISNLGRPIIHSGCVPLFESTGVLEHPVHVHTCILVRHEYNRNAEFACCWVCVWAAYSITFWNTSFMINCTTPNNKHVSPYKAIGSWLKIILYS